MFDFTRDDESIRLPIKRMITQRHNPYVGSFHSVIRSNLHKDCQSEDRIAHNSPYLPLFRHSPPSSGLGLKGLLKNQETENDKPLLTQFEVSKEKRKSSLHLRISTLRSIPVIIFDNNSSSIHNHQGDYASCAICLGAFEDGDELRSLNCSHCYHKKCIDIWLLGCMSPEDMDTTKCPQCRRTVPSTPMNESSTSDIASFTFLRIGQRMTWTRSESQWSNGSPMARNNIPPAPMEGADAINPTLSDSTLCGSSYSLCGVPLDS